MHCAIDTARNYTQFCCSFNFDLFCCSNNSQITQGYYAALPSYTALSYTLSGYNALSYAASRAMVQLTPLCTAVT